MKTIKETLYLDRPREKLKERGVRHLSNIELMAVLLGSGIKGRDVFGLSRDLLKIIDQNPDQLHLESFQKISGIGTAKACQVLASFELARRYLNVEDNPKIQTLNDLLPLVHDLRDKKQEHFVTISLDGAGQLIQKRTLFIGTLNESLVHPREVFAQALADRAAALIFVHNHPSGQVQPSDDDISLTERLVNGADLLGIEVLDHVIVGKKSCFSFQEHNLL